MNVNAVNRARKDVALMIAVRRRERITSDAGEWLIIGAEPT
jgi:hypothetical protein